MKLLLALVVLGVALSNVVAMKNKKWKGRIVGTVMVDVALSCPNGHYAGRRIDTTPAHTGAVMLCNGKDRFRTITGECNNLKHPSRGAAHEPFKRLLKAAYDDGASTPRIRSSSAACNTAAALQQPPSDGCTLPSTRLVSSTIHVGTSDLSRFTVFLMGWGQFLDHDLDLAGVEIPQTPNGCCSTLVGDLHPDTFNNGPCFPIPVPAGDLAFSRRCLEFVRSVSVTANTKASPREQQNLITHYVDGSMVYGSDEHLAEELRDNGNKAFMATRENNLLPFGERTDCIISPPDVPKCSEAGDERVDVFPTLTALHTLLVRLHNAIAKQLTDFNQHWGSERVYQESRRIVAAVIQQITYDEFIPKLLDGKTIKKYNLGSKKFNYDPHTDASVSNVFATAAYRMGHSLIPEGLNIGNVFVKTVDLFNNGKFIAQSFIDVVRGAVQNEAETRDRFMTSDLTERLFETTAAAGMGMDLMSLNIQRGRDHGLPSYNDFRKHCGLKRKKFSDLPKEFSEVYQNVDDVDVFPGAMSEQSTTKGVILGETLSCIIGQQFRDSKFGDRFFYLTNDKTVGFTKAQLKSIKKYTFAKLLCEQTPLDKIQSDAFLKVTKKNKLRNCKAIKDLDLTPWIEKCSFY